MAYAGQSRLVEAKDELVSLQYLAKDSSLLIPFTPFSPAAHGAIVAENILAGTIALLEKDHQKAIDAFSIAVSTEENMVYNEPRDWMLNPKHFLGNAYLKASRWQDAEKIFRTDLKNNNDNGWALYGLYLSLSAQKKTADASLVLAKYKKAFANADVKISSPVF